MDNDKGNTSDTNREPQPVHDKKEPDKYVFQCQRCGQCCEARESVDVSLADLERWGRDLTLPSLFNYLFMIAENEYVRISLKKTETGGNEGKGCPLYDSVNKLCDIHFSMPLFCKSFPLGYDGKRYFVKDKTCPGLGQGKMTEEGLMEARKDARSDFDSRVSTALIIPALHGLALKFIFEQSKKQMDNLSEEQKERLREILNMQEREERDE